MSSIGGLWRDFRWGGVRRETSGAAGPVQVALWAGVSGVVDLLEDAARGIRCSWSSAGGLAGEVSGWLTC